MSAAFPIDNWLEDMNQAVEQIVQRGRTVLESHRKASNKAAEDADHWNLAERLTEERAALEAFLDSVRQILEAAETCRQSIGFDSPGDNMNPAMKSCAETIEQNLPRIENAFATVRHAALDLLLWTERSAKIEGSSLPREYRESYAQLTTYASVFDPYMNAFREEALAMNNQPQLQPETQRLISALARFRAVIETARGFVRSVAEPRLELVFHETQDFLDDLKRLSTEELSTLVTEVNDCCQLLLYDPAAFRRQVEHVQPRLASGIEASLVVQTVSIGVKVVFTVDEDPVFEQLAITLLRALEAEEWAKTKDELLKALYQHFSSD